MLYLFYLFLSCYQQSQLFSLGAFFVAVESILFEIRQVQPGVAKDVLLAWKMKDKQLEICEATFSSYVVMHMEEEESLDFEGKALSCNAFSVFFFS